MTAPEFPGGGARTGDGTAALHRSRGSQVGLVSGVSSLFAGQIQQSTTQGPLLSPSPRLGLWEQ